MNIQNYMNRIFSMPTSRHIYFISILAFLFSQPGLADTFSEGGLAYKAGEYVTAAKKFLEVAEKGDHRAMYALGSMYAGGTGVDRDYKAAYLWFSRAAKYGRPDAQYKLGLMYNEGLGVPRNYKRAARLYNKSAKKGYARAQFRLGLLYAQGNGVGQSQVKSYAWLLVAKENFSKDSIVQQKAGIDAHGMGNLITDTDSGSITAELEKIRGRMTTEDLEKALRLAQEFSQYR